MTETLAHGVSNGQPLYELPRTNLQIGSRLQLIAKRSGQARNYFATLIGYIETEGVLVKTPREHGLTVLFREGEPISVRAFTGLQVYSFETHVSRILVTPFHGLYLGFPRAVTGTRLRKSDTGQAQDIRYGFSSLPGEPPKNDAICLSDVSCEAARSNQRVHWEVWAMKSIFRSPSTYRQATRMSAFRRGPSSETSGSTRKVLRRDTTRIPTESSFSISTNPTKPSCGT